MFNSQRFKGSTQGNVSRQKKTSPTSATNQKKQANEKLPITESLNLLIALMHPGLPEI